MSGNPRASPAAPGPAGAPIGKPGRSPLLFIFLTVFIDLLGFGIVIPLLPVYSKAYGASSETLSWLFASFSLMQFLFAPMWGRLSDRIGRKPVLVGGLIGTAGAYVLFANADSLTMLFASRILAGFFGANISTASAYIADVTTSENRTRGMGLIGAAFGLGFTLGPLVGGELTHLSQSAPGWFAAALSACAALFGAIKLVEPARHSTAASRVFGMQELRKAGSERRIGTLYLLGFLFIVSFACFESFFVFFGLA
jgi:multidrug resistance protein